MLYSQDENYPNESSYYETDRDRENLHRALELSKAWGVPKHCQNLHSKLLALAFTLVDHYALSPHTTQVCFFVPLEALAENIKRHRSNVWRQMNKIEAAQLAYHTPLMDTSKHLAGVVTVGSLWWVNLQGPKPRAALADDFACRYRDLDDDIAKGNTVWAMQQSDHGVNFSQLKDLVLRAEMFKEERFKYRDMTVASNEPVDNSPYEIVDNSSPPKYKLSFNLFQQLLDRPSQRTRSLHIDDLAHRIGANFNRRYVPFWRGILWRTYKTGLVEMVAGMILEGVQDVKMGHDREQTARYIGGLLLKQLRAQQQFQYEAAKKRAQNATPLAIPLSSPIRHLPVGA